jgi:hypothetical protein
LGISVLACFDHQWPNLILAFETGCCHKSAMYTFGLSAWNKCPDSRVIASALGYQGKAKVIGKQYFVRQAAILFGIAKATKDPKISAALMDKAADLKSKVDGLGAPLDLTPLAPDIEPPPGDVT